MHELGFLIGFFSLLCFTIKSRIARLGLRTPGGLPRVTFATSTTSFMTCGTVTDYDRFDALQTALLHDPLKDLSYDLLLMEDDVLS